jgi:hypothetical protein
LRLVQGKFSFFGRRVPETAAGPRSAAFISGGWETQVNTGSNPADKTTAHVSASCA